ncbi:HupE/UreJ family protein [Loktanella sp. Alg231-35]|uniref:HupE/UreJ family protein n=1 Tax=Loktanella sp. Alg231-35 TaxID=1922220 RepID=UPI001F196EDD|nr:HupE/UreJ family protein [Loktanella sp. Alg231-35]
MSSAVVVWFTTLSVANAHEVLPAIADLRADDDTVTVEVRADLESFVAGIDLTEVADTNESEAAATYDELRALPPADLQQRFEAFWPQMAQGITLTADGQPLIPELVQVDVGPVGNVEAARPSTITFNAKLPDGAETLQIGWASEFGVLVLRQMDVPEPYDGYLEAGALSEEFGLRGGNQSTGWETFVDYIPVGFDHIVPKGLDHILFVLGLFFLAARFRPLLLQVSLFTVAHTITLALAALGYTAFMDDFFLGTFGIEFIAVVEPLIALSIVYVAVENIFMKGISPWRPFVIFIFGLLHGLGFASVLAEFGLPEATFVPALIGFNVGVEVGQLFVIAVMFLCVWQALRIDRGANEAARGFVLYGVLLAVALALIALDPAGLSTLLENPVWLFAGPLAAVFVLCMASIGLRDQQEAYRRLVAVPCSLAIAFVGAYWFIERTIL